MSQSVLRRVMLAVVLLLPGFAWAQEKAAVVEQNEQIKFEQDKARTTAILALCFFLTSIGLTLLAVRGAGSGGSLFDGATTQDGQAPATGETGGSVLPKLPAAPATPQVPVSQ